MPETHRNLDTEFDPQPGLRSRRRLAIAATALLLLLVLALTPPLLNVNRLRRRISTSMSQSLGRPVHLDSVTMHLLPMPGFTLENLVVSEDPAFGSEPVIRADTVEATLRAGSLWRRQVEFSTIRFLNPSVNIVRNAQGRWNLEDILLQAAHVNAAPTAQRKAGSAPRFPYIEATGARVNLKLGEEKMPFSLTDADFALWLPSPRQWRIRIQGKPARTDTNASDTGEVRLEGTLGRAATLAEVPLNLTAGWAHAPLGEASRLLTGDDEGWRGTVDAGATLTGNFGAAKLTADVHLTDLRRTDFVPTKLLDVSAHCTADADLGLVTLALATCTIPAGGPQPLAISSPALDLDQPGTAAAVIEVPAVPLDWALDWARLFTQRIPPELDPAGTLHGTLSRPAGSDASQTASQTAFWTGDLRATLRSAHAAGRELDFSEKPMVFDWRAAPAATAAAMGDPELQLQPVALRLGNSSQLVLTGSIGPRGYAFQLTGSTGAAQIAALGDAVLPPLGQELVETMKLTPASPPAPVEIQCIRPFSTQQSCTPLHPEPPKPPRPRRRR